MYREHGEVAFDGEVLIVRVLLRIDRRVVEGGEDLIGREGEGWGVKVRALAVRVRVRVRLGVTEVPVRVSVVRRRVGGRGRGRGTCRSEPPWVYTTPAPLGCGGTNSWPCSV
jgi:hypothetical protein